MTLKIGTVFSGIGAPEQALVKMGVDFEIAFACDNGEIEIKEPAKKIMNAIKGLSQSEANDYVKKIYLDTGKINYVKKSYMENYSISENEWYEDIRFLDGKKFNKNIDILIGGSPCQSFSIIGKRGGLEDTRGTLFYEYARLIQEIQPKVFIYENVPGMLTHDKGNTWSIISGVFDSLGYRTYKEILNSKDYGIPQDRKRLFVIGFKNNKVNFSFPQKMPLELTMFDLLDKDFDEKYFLGKKGFEFVTNPKYKNRARVNSPVIQTEKANQQFNWNGDFVFVPYESILTKKSTLKRAYISTWKGQCGAIRQLSPRECLRLMGFSDSFKIVVPNVQAYRQAGNSIVVNVLEKLFAQIFKAVNFDD